MLLNNILLKSYRFKLFRKILIKFFLYKEGGFSYSESIRYIYQVYHGIKIGYGSYGGCFDLAKIRSGVCFGNYCSIAHNVTILTANHPINFFTTHPITYEASFGCTRPITNLTRTSIAIGHDVWIGCNVVILPSVKTIGNGAIIGAGSIVTKDVLPYTIVAGNPAKDLRKRFDQNVIDELEASNWWLLKNVELSSRIKEFENITNVK